MQIQRQIRSFVRRCGRISHAQQQALEKLWSLYGYEQHESPTFEKLFARVAPINLEIGIGNGLALTTMAQNHPEQNYIGIDVHKPGLGNTLITIEQHQIQNIRLFCADAVEILKELIPNHSLANVFLFFPDPWPKLRHRKRRLVQPEFVTLIAEKLIPGGKFFLATDWEDYAIQMMRVLSSANQFQNAYGVNQFAPRVSDRPITKFEQRGENLGHQVWDLVFINNSK
ncbi:MAG: tRNA (guanosine(46)-N7)-methyltransferase TrmB [Gammaproteobacteria bacterium]